MSSRALVSRHLASLPPRTTPLLLRATITTTSSHQKAVVDSAKDTLTKVDHAISQKLVDGIDIGTKAADTLKSTTESARDKAQDLVDKVRTATSTSTGEAKGKVHEAAGAAKGMTSEATGKAKGAMGEAAGKTKGAMDMAKGKMDEMASNVKGAAKERWRGM